MCSRPIHVHRSIRNPILIFTVTFLIRIPQPMVHRYFLRNRVTSQKVGFMQLESAVGKQREVGKSEVIKLTFKLKSTDQSWNVFNAVLSYQTLTNFGSNVPIFRFFNYPFQLHVFKFSLYGSTNQNTVKGPLKGCINQFEYCDGNQDCEDGSDEPHTCKKCDENQFQCKSKDKCIAQVYFHTYANC